jgi:hypothetical protein
MVHPVSARWMNDQSRLGFLREYPGKNQPVLYEEDV